MTRPTKPCATCGKHFEISRADSTVRCLSCRKGRTAKKAKCVVCLDTKVITSRRSDGTVVTDSCFRCVR
jgi:DNA-directed RNA polymerase subunit RPC12/RpoP